ncbi:expressed unknown protein [Seminavis robusta]|uniref:Uncharacterized protein n=1 Tax=Seminavis robusta TaxID=568900 RepID=A0A9N8ERQ9_9STRA|nr:expressed unknown protein [Seminavis robusta]|eukprot:Sro1647_g288360.1 n/a (222) ;mRNA; r:6305-6970
MKMFTHFFSAPSSKEKPHHHGDKTVASEASGRTHSSHSSKKSHGSGGHKASSKSLKQVKEHELPEEIWHAKPVKVKIVEDWIKNSNRHRSDKLLEAFASGRSKVHLEDGFSTHAETFCDGMQNIYEAFPDFAFHYDSIEQENSTTVAVEGLVASGTHTGAPYTIDAKHFPAIPATGRHVINDEERFVFVFTDDNKIKSFAVIGFGNVTGPPGLYEQIGGNV